MSQLLTESLDINWVVGNSNDPVIGWIIGIYSDVYWFSYPMTQFIFDSVGIDSVRGDLICMSNSLKTFEFSLFLNLLILLTFWILSIFSKFKKDENSKVSSEFDIKIIVPTCSSSIFIPIYRDRHAFSELDSFMGKTSQKRFRIEICAIKKSILKKRIKKLYSWTNSIGGAVDTLSTIRLFGWGSNPIGVQIFLSFSNFFSILF